MASLKTGAWHGPTGCTRSKRATSSTRQCWNAPARNCSKQYCYHFGLLDQFEEVKAHTKVRIATMPWITAFFMPRGKGDRPEVIPDGCVNLACLGQFVETPDDCVFTTEGSARTAMMAVYGLLDLDRDIPPIWPTQYDIRSLLASAKTLNNGRLPGSWLLSKLLKNTYYEDILP